MFTSLFRKSTFINYFLVIFTLFIFYFLFQFRHQTDQKSAFLEIVFQISILTASFFLVNFIVKKNGLTKNSSYPILFFLLLLAMFPGVFINLKLLIANFLLLLSFRRMISLQSLKAPKQKIFDASMWIFIASLFHFWCIIFIVLVYISIIFHVSRDYRNWIIPFIAFFTSIVVFFLFSLIFEPSLINSFKENLLINIDWNYFVKNYQNGVLSLYLLIAIYFTFSMIFTLTNKPLILQASYKKMIFGVVIGIIVFLITPSKNHQALIFTFFPLAVLATNNIEYANSKKYQEIILVLMVIISLISFYSKL
ncbi:DUF6427 family protein [Flavobacterium sp.]|uniref:DUF6427 family protein n=1 Tax=Flavobacterium sp. TaxID=239 RepID=UPI0035AEB549